MDNSKSPIDEALTSLRKHFDEENYGECLSSLEQINSLAESNVEALRGREAEGVSCVLAVLESDVCGDTDFPGLEFLDGAARLARSLGLAGKDILRATLQCYPDVWDYFDESGLDWAAYQVAGAIEEALTIADEQGWRDEANQVIADFIGVSAVHNAIAQHLEDNDVVPVDQTRMSTAMRDQMVNAANMNWEEEAALAANWFLGHAPEVLADDMIASVPVQHPILAVHTAGSFALSCLAGYSGDPVYDVLIPLIELLPQYPEDERRLLCRRLMFVLHVHGIPCTSLLDKLPGISECFVVECLRDHCYAVRDSSPEKLLAAATRLRQHADAQIRHTAEQAMKAMEMGFYGKSP